MTERRENPETGVFERKVEGFFGDKWVSDGDTEHRISPETGVYERKTEGFFGDKWEPTGSRKSSSGYSDYSWDYLPSDSSDSDNAAGLGIALFVGGILGVIGLLYWGLRSLGMFDGSNDFLVDFFILTPVFALFAVTIIVALIRS